MLKTRLKSLRKQAGMSQKQLATLLEITERQYQRYEAGQIDIPSSKIIFLANLFEVSIDHLLCNDEQD